MTTTADELSRRFAATSEAAKERFAQYTRSSAFSLALGVREIRMLAGRPWDPDKSMANADLGTLQKLFAKGLLAGQAEQRPALTEAGRLTRQLLVYSGHIEPRDVWTKPPGVLELLRHAADWYNAGALGYPMARAELRDIDGERHLVMRLNEGMGNYSEWAIPYSAVRRIG